MSTMTRPSESEIASAADPSQAQRSSRHAWLIVMRREMAVKVRDRNFLISTGLMLVLLVAGFGVQLWLAQSTQTKNIAVSGADAVSVVTQAQTDAHAAGASVHLRSRTVADPAAVRSAVLNGSADAGLVRDGAGWQLISKTDRDSTISTWVGRAASAQVLNHNAAIHGLTATELTQGTAVPYNLLASGRNDKQMTAQISGTVFGVLFYLAALVFGAAIANSVVEEKQNRIVEIIAAAIPTRQLLLGKILGNTVLAVVQVVTLSAIGAIGLAATGHGDVLSRIASGGILFFVFFLVGFIALASLWAVVGSLASRNEDIQSTSAPMTMLAIGIFLLGILAKGTLLTVISFIPLLSTIAMPARIVGGEAAWWQAAISLVLAVAGAVLIVWVAERLYRRALLQTGRRLRLREVWAQSDV